MVNSLVAFTSLLLLFAIGIGLLLLIGKEDTSIWLALCVALAPPAMLLIGKKWPAIYLAPVVYIGNFKDHPAEGFSFSDPTFVCVAVLLLIVGMRLLAAGLEHPGTLVTELFSGQRKAVVAFLGFQGIVALSCVYTMSPQYGHELATKFATIGLLLFVAPFVLIREEQDFRHFVFITIALAVLLAFKRMLVIVTTSNVVGDITQISAGELLGIAVLLIMTYKLTDSRASQVALMVALPVLAAGLIAADARGPALTCLVLIGLSMLSKKKVEFRASRVTQLSLIVIILVSISIALAKMSATASGAKVKEKETELQKLLSGEAPGGSAGARLWGYEAAISGFIRKPLTGWGAGGSFGYMATHRGLFGRYGADVQLQYPHNIYLQVAMEQGIFGFALFCTFLYFIFRATRRLSQCTNGRLCCFLWIMVFNCVTIMVSGDLDNERHIWMWCGIALAMNRNALLSQRVDVSRLRSSTNTLQPDAVRWARSA